MASDKVINIGDVCTYRFDTANKSLSIVEVVEELSDKCVVVKFHQVIVDDSGNGYFTYLCNTGKTMNVSKKYLTKIDLINCQKAEIESWKEQNVRLNKECDHYIRFASSAKSEAIKEFAKRLKAVSHPYGNTQMVFELQIDNLVKEMVGDDK